MKFHSRIFIVLMAVVVLLEGATFLAVLNTTRNDFIEQGRRELSLGGLIFDSAIDSRSRELAVGVGVLAGDFGFKRAAAVGDEATIESALINNANRIHADLTLLIGRDGNVRASSRPVATLPSGAAFPLKTLLESEPGSESTIRRLVVIDGSPMQIVLAPVRAPDLIAWVAVGYAIDDALAQRINTLTNLEVSFVDFSSSQPRLVASTLAPEARGAFTHMARDQLTRDQPAIVELDGGEMLSLRHLLQTADGYQLDAVLAIDMDVILSGYNSLRSKLLLIMLATLVLAAIASRVLARTVSRPLHRLAEATRRISRGDYRSPVRVDSNDELGILAKAFEEMQRGIQNREDQIVYQSQHDSLTGLPNRNMVTDRLQHAVSRGERKGSVFSLLMLDLDGFRDVNDTLGHATGDRVLQEVSGRLRSTGRECDTVARLGGDEFVLLLEDTDYVGAMRTAVRLVDSIDKAVPVQSMQIRVSASIGIASYPQHGRSAEEILRRADIAMYTAKEADERIAVYEVGQDEDHLRRLELVRDLSDALDEEQLSVVYQPKLDMKSGKVTGVEALVRWPHPRYGFVSPEEFVPLAEQSGYVRRMTHQVLGTALAQLREWREAGLPMKMSINLSAHDLLDPQLPAIVAGLLSRHSVSGEQLTLEITESAVMKDTAQTRDVMARLRAQGIRLSIDDFGTGQSSLAQLKRLPVDELKIDKSFVLELARNADDAAIVRSTIELGHILGLSVTAEGVENDLSRKMLREYRCDCIQGYLLSRPLSAADFLNWMKNREAPDVVSDEQASDSGHPAADEFAHAIRGI